MNRNDLKELFAYILLGVVATAISIWEVTQIAHKEKAIVVESGCKP